MKYKWVVFGHDFHLYGLSENTAKTIARLLGSENITASAMSEQIYRYIYNYQGRISTDK